MISDFRPVAAGGDPPRIRPLESSGVIFDNAPMSPGDAEAQPA
jgi:hypothetical protein